MAYIIAVLLFLEVSLQIFYRVTTGAYLFSRDKLPIFSSDPISGWTNTAGLSYRHVTPEFTADIYTNSQGFRVSLEHEEYDRKKAKGTFRILLLGPSFAFGWGVNYESTFGAQLQQRLDKVGFAGLSKVEVLNHGVPHLPPANGLEWFNSIGKEYEPDLVIQFIYGSLAVRAKPATSVDVRNGYIVLATSGFRDKVWAYAKNSATVFYSGVLITLFQKSIYRQDEEGRIEGAGRDMSNSPDFSPDDASVKESLLLYRNLKRAVEAAGAKLLIVYFPLSYVVHPEDRARWVLHGVKSIDRQVNFNRAFDSYLDERGIQCLNLTDDFIEIARTDKSRLYFWLDIHWTELGNAAAAQLVARYLTERQAIVTGEPTQILSEMKHR
jgi:hypothetical protein